MIARSGETAFAPGAGLFEDCSMNSRKTKQYKSFQHLAGECASTLVQGLLGFGYPIETLFANREGLCSLAEAALLVDAEMRNRLLSPLLTHPLRQAEQIPPNLMRFHEEDSLFADGFLPALVTTLRQQIERLHEQHKQELDQARTAQWLAENNLVSAETLMGLLGLRDREMRAAEEHNLIPGATRRPWDHGSWHTPQYYPANTQLSQAQRAEIAQCTLYSRIQAAERLGITPGQFDRLKKKAGLERAGTYYSRSSGQTGYLYRQCDIDSLRSFSKENQR